MELISLKDINSAPLVKTVVEDSKIVSYRAVGMLFIKKVVRGNCRVGAHIKVENAIGEVVSISYYVTTEILILNENA